MTMVAFALMFACNLLLVGTLIRLVEAKFPDTRIAKALMFAY